MPFGPMLLGDFAGSFAKESDLLRQENLRRGEADREREQRILEHLSTSDDPEIRSAAVTGMLTRGEKTGGLHKWFGQQEGHPAFQIISGLIGQGHQPFLSPAEEQAKKVQAQYEGEITGTSRSYKNLTGRDLAPEAVQRMVETRFRGYPRQFATHTTNVKYTDEEGEVRTKGGIIYDPNERTYLNADGSPFEYADSIVAESRSGNFSEPGAYRGAFFTTEPDPNSHTGYSKVHRTAEGKEIGRAPAMYTPPPTFTGSPVPTTEGYYGLTRGGRMAPVPGSAPPPAVAPQIGAGQLEQTLRSVESAANAETLKIGGIRDPRQYQASLDKHAQRAGFRDYADLERQHGDAVRGVGQHVAPPQAPATPKGRGSIDVNKVLDYLKRSGRGQ